MTAYTRTYPAMQDKVRASPLRNGLMAQSKLDSAIEVIKELSFEDKMAVLDFLLGVKSEHEFAENFSEVIPGSEEMAAKVVSALAPNESSSEDGLAGWMFRFRGMDHDARFLNFYTWEKAAIWCVAQNPFADPNLRLAFLAHCDQAQKYPYEFWRVTAYQIAKKANLSPEQAVERTQELLSTGYLRLYAPRHPDAKFHYWAFGPKVHEALAEFDVEAFLQEKFQKISDQSWRIWICLRLAHRPLTFDELAERIGISSDELRRGYFDSIPLTPEEQQESGHNVQGYWLPKTTFFVDETEDNRWVSKGLGLLLIDPFLQSEIASQAE